MPRIWYNDRGRILEVDGQSVTYKHANPPQVDSTFTFVTVPEPDPVLLALNYRVNDSTKTLRPATNSEMVDAQLWHDVTMEYKNRLDADPFLRGLIAFLADDLNLEQDRLAKRITTEMRGFSDV